MLHGEATKKPAEKKDGETKIRRVDEVDLSKMLFNEKRIEYAERIVCGMVSGALAGLSISVEIFRTDTEMVVEMVDLGVEKGVNSQATVAPIIGRVIRLFFSTERKQGAEK